MAVMRLDYESLRNQSKRFGTESSNVSDMISRLDTLLNDLQGEWEGQASEAFNAQYQEIKPSIRDLEELLEKIQGQLISVANTIEQNEAEIARQINA